MMKIQFQLTIKDFLAMQQDVIHTSYAHAMKGKYFRWGIAIVLLAVGLLLLKTSAISTVISIAIAGLFFLFAPALYATLAFAKLKKQIDKMGDSPLLQPCTMQFSEAGMERMIAGEVTDFRWDKFERWSEDAAHYFLYVTDLQGVIIPKDPQYIEQNDSKEFQTMLTTYISIFLKNS